MFLDLVRADRRMVDFTRHPHVNVRASNGTARELRGLNPWSSVSREMPSGYRPGATGSTQSWVEYWQIGERPSSWKFWEPNRPQPIDRSFLVVAGATWTHIEAGDNETRVVFEVQALLTTIKPSFDAHSELARSLAERMALLLRAVPAPDSASRWRT
jgi:hypothetical protein